MLRIDPLTETGVFDTEFFRSDEYTAYRKMVEQYLENEGFEDIPKPIANKIGNQLWSVRDTTK